MKKIISIVLTLGLVLWLLNVQITNSTVTAAETSEFTMSSSRSLIRVDGDAATELYTYIYNGANYVKLRDLAAILDGSYTQFNVGFDEGTQTINITTDTPYTARDGLELRTSENTPELATAMPFTISIDGKQISLYGYNVGASNYFAIRDLGPWIGFGVDFDPSTGAILLSTLPEGTKGRGYYGKLLKPLRMQEASEVWQADEPGADSAGHFTHQLRALGETPERYLAPDTSASLELREIVDNAVAGNLKDLQGAGIYSFLTRETVLNGTENYYEDGVVTDYALLQYQGSLSGMTPNIRDAVWAEDISWTLEPVDRSQDWINTWVTEGRLGTIHGAVPSYHDYWVVARAETDIVCADGALIEEGTVLARILIHCGNPVAENINTGEGGGDGDGEGNPGVGSPGGPGSKTGGDTITLFDSSENQGPRRNESPSDDFEYSETDSGIVIDKYIGQGGAVMIPGYIGGKPVTGIGNGAFERCNGVIVIQIPATVAHIGPRAFYGCPRLRTVSILHNVTSIADDAFSEEQNVTIISVRNSDAYKYAVRQGIKHVIYTLPVPNYRWGARLTVPLSIMTNGMRYATGSRIPIHFETDGSDGFFCSYKRISSRLYITLGPVIMDRRLVWDTSWLAKGEYILTIHKFGSDGKRIPYYAVRITISRQSKPIPVLPPEPAPPSNPPLRPRVIVAGRRFSLVVRVNGSLWAWGLHGNNISAGKKKRLPVKIDSGAVSVASGFQTNDDSRGANNYDAYMIKADGNLWGTSISGCKNGSKPVMILEDVIFVAQSGQNHGLAITGDDSLWAWGSNTYGQIGDGTIKDRNMPVKVMDDVILADVGFNRSSALKADGSLWIWGWDNGSHLGTFGGSNIFLTKPKKVMNDVVSFAQNNSHSASTYVIKTDGSLWAWGKENRFGELGDGTTIGKYFPVKPLDDAASVAAGSSNVFAIKTDGSLWAWGRNLDGELGDGTTTNRYKPEKIMNHVASIFAGETHTLAVKTDGSLWAWGRNLDGELGDGSTASRRSPVMIWGPGKVSTK